MTEPAHQSDGWPDLSVLLRDAPNVRRQMHQVDPAPGSPASQELADSQVAFGSDDVVRRAIEMADLWTLIAGEHLHGIGVLLASDSDVFALFPLVRSAIEHAAWTCWILDNTADSRERAKRAALAELRSNEEALKVANRLAGKQHPAYVEAKQARAKTWASLQAAFGAAFNQQAQTIDNDDAARPADVVEHLGALDSKGREWLGMYDYLCSTANHPTLSAIDFFDTTDNGTVLFVSRDMAERLIRAALSPVVRSLSHFAAYMGWPRTAIDSYIVRINEVLAPVP